MKGGAGVVAGMVGLCGCDTGGIVVLSDVAFEPEPEAPGEMAVEPSGDRPSNEAGVDTPETSLMDDTSDTSQAEYPGDMPVLSCAGCFIGGTCYVNLSCSGELSTLAGTFTVGGLPLVDANVQVGSTADWQATTDETGLFIITGIELGEHDVYVEKKLDDGGVVSLADPVFLSAGVTNLGEISLPEPLALEVAARGSSETSLAWTRYQGRDFREYKLYRGEAPGVDETTGELIFVSTEADAIEFVDAGYTSGLDYYYRVYVLADSGKLAGSNIETIRTPAENLVSNAGFELAPSPEDPLPDWVVVNGGVALDADAVSGVASMRLTAPVGAEPDFWVWQGLALTRFDVSRNYTLSGWARATPGSVAALYVWRADTGRITEFLGTDGGSDWQYFETTFAVPSSGGTLLLTLELYTPLTVGAGEMAWFDDLALTVQTNAM